MCMRVMIPIGYIITIRLFFFQPRLLRTLMVIENVVDEIEQSIEYNVMITVQQKILSINNQYAIC